LTVSDHHRPTTTNPFTDKGFCRDHPSERQTPLHPGDAEVGEHAVEGLDKETLGSWRYDDHDVVQGLENYFAGVGEEPGRWVGRGAAETGFAGEADGGALRLLFDEGRHPATAEALDQPYVHRADRATVTGYALSFSPPKSISLVWAMGDERAAAEVRAAHDDPVAAALSFLEEHAAFARSGQAGVFQADTSGLMAAAFVHRSSRALDPQLHTHVLLANKVRRSDGQWRSLDGRRSSPPRSRRACSTTRPYAPS